MTYQLLRTNISLTGNVQINNYIKQNGVDRLSLSPLSSAAYHSTVKINDKSSFGKDLIKYYNKYSDIFYNPIIPATLTGGGIININDKYIDNRISYHEYGVKRCCKDVIGTNFNIFAPIFIQNINEIPDYIELTIKKEEDNYPEFKHRVNIAKNVNNPTYRYLYNSLKDLGELGNNIKMINISPSSRESYIIGRSTKTGSISNIKSDLPIHLYSNDQTWIEFDSRIMKEYSRYKLISPYIFNLSFCFNLEDIFYNIKGFVEIGKSYKMNLQYFKDGAPLEFKDFDTNHEFIFDKSIDKNGKDKYTNILDHNYEYDIDYIRDDNKQRLVPYICKWILSDSNDEYIFNNCWGYENLKKLNNNNLQYNIKYRSHTEGEAVNNTYWCDSLFIENNDKFTDSNVLSKLLKGDTVEGNKLNRYNVKDKLVIIRGVKYDISKLGLFDMESDKQISISNTKVSISKTVTTGKERSIVYYTISGNACIYIDIIFFKKNITNKQELDNSLFIDELRDKHIDSCKITSVNGNISGGNLDNLDEYRGINLYNCISFPYYIYINKPVISRFKEGSSKRELIVNTNTSINLYRYGGWIYPRMLDLDLDTYKISNDVIYLYKKNKVSSDSIFQKVSMSSITGDVLDSYDSSKSHYANYNTFPEIFEDSYTVKEERRWFFDSTILNLANVIVIECDYNNITGNYIDIDVERGLRGFYNIYDDKVISYINTQYKRRVYRENESSKYNIELKLK